MAILKAREIRQQSDAELRKKLNELKLELLRQRAQKSQAQAKLKIREIKRTIARIKTILHERKMQESKKQENKNSDSRELQQ